ncbi:hypothetical protein K402DRAFT_391337 [Aulographum hederae CBS 113979]|uniref:EF-hand n=1 Tax=Aulographum hederae CBS 113979 TaxID=1176131 RepID=A0A6G1H7J2_9PEZI|nr:hypothetical protein K402DRAFT_391337 [Aulographum hederae CBS 113979]
MADSSVDLNHPRLGLSPEEKRLFTQLFKQADSENVSVVTGEDAVKFFERTNLPATVLGEIWQIADVENRGFLEPPGFCICLRLIGHYQSGREPSPELAFQPGPLPQFDGWNPPAPPGPPPAAAIQPQLSGTGPIRVPPLDPGRAADYAAMFEKSGTHDGVMSGETAKQFFDKARLPNDVLGRIWNLADTEQRGALSVTEFIIAMHLLASFKSRAMAALPNQLPAGLYEAASRRGAAPRPIPGPGPAAIPRQFSGAGPQRTSSPLSRPPYGAPPQSPYATGNDWLITPQEKQQYDLMFARVDTKKAGYILGEQAVSFFSDSGLGPEILATIWDLADINSEGRLNPDEFAVAMHLIRHQRGKNPANLPETLPANLIPPSMRNQVRPTAQPTAPAFPEPPAVPKSASEDLFGLDAFTSSPPPVQTQQTTGGSGNFKREDPFGSKTSSPTSPKGFQPAQRAGTGSFKPFTPTSAFGQSAFGQGLQSQNTGASGSSSSQARGMPAQASAMDDLLGDNDPEISKKLTKETSELANMSNQIGTLTNQMKEVQNKKSTTESDLNSTSTQKRDLELRLSQFRQQYENEVRSVRNLEERLSSSRSETQKLRQELSSIENEFHQVQNQHREIGAALQADQQENATLKERIRQTNSEIGTLKPQLEKMRLDARQQKGMVSINKKQLATNESERDKMKTEMGDLSRQATENARSAAQESQVVSPALSTTSRDTNPFFKKSPQGSVDNGMKASGFHSAQNQGQDKFDNFFGRSSGTPQSANPQVSSRGLESNIPTFSTGSGPSVESSEPGVPTPSASPPLSNYHESPRTGEPPAPPDGRQFTSRELPIRDTVPRSESFSSSVRVGTPGTRYGAGGAETPTAGGTNLAHETGSVASENSRPERETFGSTMFPSGPTPGSMSRTGSGSRGEDLFKSFGQPSGLGKEVPGAFPDDEPMKPSITGGSAFSQRSKESGRGSEGFQSSRSDPFGAPERTAGKPDFDAAFASFGNMKPTPEGPAPGSTTNGSADPSNKFNSEFPPIEDLSKDDDSDTSEDRGFDDDFTQASPAHRRQTSSGQAQAQASERPETSDSNANSFLGTQRPTISQVASTSSDLPTPNAQQSPPTYDQAMPPQRTMSGSRDPNQFPSEFGGLLPSREDPTHSPPPSQSPEQSLSTTAGGHGEALFGNRPEGSSPTGATSSFQPTSPLHEGSSTEPSSTYHSATSYVSGTDKNNKAQSPLEPSSTATVKPAFPDDFDDGFDDLADAAEADDKGDDDFLAASRGEDFDDFNPTFDSPSASKSASQATPTAQSSSIRTAEGSFGDFDSMTQSFAQPKSVQAPQASTKHDWDAIFSGLDQSTSDPAKDLGSTTESSGVGFGSSSGMGSAFTDPKSNTGMGMGMGERREEESSGALSPPQLTRALSASSEHDDPILKDLTSMGYSRSNALAALEKYDYDKQKAAEYLLESH